jgi:hypothetical protein
MHSYHNNIVNVYNSTSNIIYVDNAYGKDIFRQKSSIINPYKTINFALSTLSNVLKDSDNQYVISVAPGNYNEIVNMLPFVNIVGGNRQATSILGLHAYSVGSITNFTIKGTVFPLISIETTDSTFRNNDFIFDNVYVHATNIRNLNDKGIIYISGLGKNVRFNQSIFNFEVSSENNILIPQIFFNIETIAHFNNITVNCFASYKSEIITFNITDANTYINNSTVVLNINDGPSKPVSLYKVKGNAIPAALTLNNTKSTVNVLVIDNPYKSPINYINSLDANIITDNHSTVNLTGVSDNFINLVNVENKNANIELNGLIIQGNNVPKISGFTSTVKYTILSGLGSVNLNGALYTNIATVSNQSNEYFIQENDATILSNDTNIHIYDPIYSKDTARTKGKIVIIKNIGSSSIIINGDNNCIFDGTITLQSKKFTKLQSDGVKWYIIG